MLLSKAVWDRAAAPGAPPGLTLHVVQQALGALEALLGAPLLLLQLGHTPGALVQLYTHTVFLPLQLLGSGGEENIMLKKTPEKASGTSAL